MARSSRISKNRTNARKCHVSGFLGTTSQYPGRRRAVGGQAAKIDAQPRLAALLAGLLRQRRRGGSRLARARGTRCGGVVALDVREPAAQDRVGEGVQSVLARTRLRLAAYRHRDGERRHALSGGFDQPRADGARPRAALSDASHLCGVARRLGNFAVSARTRGSGTGQADLGKEAAPGVVSAHRGGSHRRSRGAPVPRLADRAQHARRASGMRRLGQDARRHPAGGAGVELLERTPRCGRFERSRGAARLDGGSPLHLPGLPRIPIAGAQGTGELAAGRGHRSWDSAPRALAFHREQSLSGEGYPPSEPFARHQSS